MRTMLSMAVAALALAAAPAALADDGLARTSELEAAISPLLTEDAPVYATMKDDAPVSGLRHWFNYAPREADPFDHMARPITNVDFHHPFIWNEIRPFMMYHRIPETSVLGGGDIRAYGLELGFKLTPELQLSINKGGYADFNTDALPDGEGWMDVEFGLKYKAWEDLSAPAIASVGFLWEPKIGATEIAHGRGSSQFDLFGTYARDLGVWNFIGTLGYKFAGDGDEDADAVHWHLHADYPMSPTIRMVGEVNGYRYVSSADDSPSTSTQEGFDYTSLRAGDVAGHNVITAALGFRWFATDDINMGLAYEKSITGRDDIFDDRWTLDMVLRF